ncbi:dUTP diphosphatase [bacterium]|nr:dUTP diphosphatase [bacterium]
MAELTIKVKFLRDSAKLPGYMTEHSSGVDLSAGIDEPVTIPSGGFTTVPTGIAIEIPEGYEGQVRPRSGLAAKEGIGLLNAPGTIDADYRGEVKIILFNFSKEDFVINPGDRIAQLVFTRVHKAEIEKVDDLSQTERGKGGFGHTGK